MKTPIRCQEEGFPKMAVRITLYLCLSFSSPGSGRSDIITLPLSAMSSPGVSVGNNTSQRSAAQPTIASKNQLHHKGHEEHEGVFGNLFITLRAEEFFEATKGLGACSVELLVIQHIGLLTATGSGGQRISRGVLRAWFHRASCQWLSTAPPILLAAHWLNEEYRTMYSLEPVFQHLRRRAAYFIYVWYSAHCPGGSGAHRATYRANASPPASRAPFHPPLQFLSAARSIPQRGSHCRVLPPKLPAG